MSIEITTQRSMTIKGVVCSYLKHQLHELTVDMFLNDDNLRQSLLHVFLFKNMSTSDRFVRNAIVYEVSERSEHIEHKI